MLKKLAAGGYLAYVARGEAKLTERGLSVAVRVMRRHRLAECFLADILGMPWDEVNEEACRLEHAISARVEERLVAVLGNPKFCPHGLPIPPADLSEPERMDRKLADVDAGSKVRIVDVHEDVPGIRSASSMRLGSAQVQRSTSSPAARLAARSPSPGRAVAMPSHPSWPGLISVDFGGTSEPETSLRRRVTRADGNCSVAIKP